ncbi:MAG: hypothetical protein KDC54_01745, partial [Lewinella sp.]|nr:hypothetical protein [Lewinella sp.]
MPDPARFQTLKVSTTVPYCVLLCWLLPQLSRAQPVAASMVATDAGNCCFTLQYTVSEPNNLTALETTILSTGIL